MFYTEISWFLDTGYFGDDEIWDNGLVAMTMFLQASSWEFCTNVDVSGKIIEILKPELQKQMNNILYKQILVIHLKSISL